MRTSVKVKNFIAKVIIAIGVFLFVGGAGGIDLNESFLTVLKICGSGAILAFLGGKLLEW